MSGIHRLNVCNDCYLFHHDQGHQQKLSARAQDNNTGNSSPIRQTIIAFQDQVGGGSGSTQKSTNPTAPHSILKNTITPLSATENVLFW